MFSELVDTVIRRTNRPDFKEDIIAYVNETMRAVQNDSLFTRDMVEDVAYDINKEENIVEPLNVYVWKRPPRMRQLRAVAYENRMGMDRYYPVNIPPSNTQLPHDSYYYGSGDSIVFCDSAGLFIIKVAYYQNFRTLKYYEEGKRPAVFNTDTEQWSYLNENGEYVDTLEDEVAEQQARELVSNWLLMDYQGLLINGANTKVFSVLNDPRNKVEYSNFQTALKDLRRIEKYEATGYNKFKG